MTFDLDKDSPRLPSSIAFKIPVTVKNLIIHHCIIDEGASFNLFHVYHGL